MQIWGQSCLPAHLSAASVGLDGRVDSAPTLITGENRSDCSYLQGQTSISKECIRPTVTLSLLKIVSLKDFE